MFVRTTCLAVFALTAASWADVVREGAGPRRDALNAMELTPFDAALWGRLAPWSGGDPLDGARTGGSVVLICTWSSWYQPSIRQGLSGAQNAFQKFGGKGLIVVGVHHREGWPEAAAAAAGAGVTFPIAHDAKNEFRDALKVDQDPDFYLIDRAGHLRYADLATASLEQAVAELVAETKEKASDLPRLLRERGEEARAAAARNQPIRAEIELNTLPPVPPGYEAPPLEDYERARWPVLTPEEAQAVGLTAPGDQGEAKQLSISPGVWFPKEPTFDGRAIVVYLWHPDLPRSYSILDRMDRLQAAHVRDLVVIGALTPAGSLDQSRQNTQNPETPESLEPKLRAFLKARHYGHTLAGDFAGSALQSLAGAAGSSAGFPIPGAMVVSSEGTIRWAGSANSPKFQSAVDTVILSDPGVRARREADRKFIENARK